MLKSLAAFMILTAPLSAATAQRDVENAPDPWIHQAIGAAFPAKLGEFTRGSIREYSEDGRDASAAYSLARQDGNVTVTIYVFPSQGETCDQQYEGAKQNISAYPGARLVGEEPANTPDGTGEAAARTALYELPAGSMHPNLPALRSELYLFCPAGSEWMVKGRASWSGKDRIPPIAALMKSVNWPAPLGH